MDRSDLRRRETAIWARMLDSMMAQYWVVFTLKLLGVVGGSILGAIGGGIEGPLRDAAGFTLKAFTIFSGAGVAGLSGIILLLGDRERPNLINDVRHNLDALRDYIDRREEMISRESWRVDCDTANRVMLESVENLLIHPSGSISDDVQTVFDVCTPTLLDALGMEFEEDYTISVFQRDAVKNKMVRIAESWFNQDEAQHDKREWDKGQGFTGQSWSAKHTIGVPDANDPVARQIYAMAPQDYPEALKGFGIRPDEERFRSFACVPIMVGADSEPWGILTVTSDAIGRFDAVDGDSRGADNIPTLRLAAALVALVAAANSKD